MAAGYAKKSLVEKLGIKAGAKIIVLNPPPNYAETLGKLPPNTTIVDKLESALDFIQFFTKGSAELEKQFRALKKSLAPDGMLWISWPKGAAKMQTDLNENIVREIGLNHQLVDVKVCAIDKIWSGLKFVYRLKDRQPKA